MPAASKRTAVARVVKSSRLPARWPVLTSDGGWRIDTTRGTVPAFMSELTGPLARPRPAGRAVEWRARWVVWACCALSFAFRVPSLRWGLPYLLHPDEPTNFGVVLRMLKQHDPNPHFFRYPSLFFYTNALVQLAHHAVSRVLGGTHSLSDLPNMDLPVAGGGFSFQPSTFVVARLLSAACGVTTVWVAYRIGRALSKDARVGLLAASLVAVSPSVLRDSRWLAPDGMVTLTVTATLLASLSALASGSWKHYFWAATLTGLTASLKYNGAIVGLTVCSAALLRDGPRAFRNPRLYAAPLIAIGAFLLTSPYVALDFRHFWRDFMLERAHYARGHDGAEGNTLAFYAEYLLSWEGPAAVLALAGLIFGVVRRDKGIALLAAFCAAYFCFINLFVMRNGQTLVPMVPALLVAAAWFATQAWVWLEPRLRARNLPDALGFGLAALAVVLLVGFPLSGSMERTRPLLLKDNRELASIWIESHIPEHSRIAVEAYGCYVDRARYSLTAIRTWDSRNYAWFRRHEDYLIFSGDSFNRYLEEPERYPVQAEGYRRLFREFELVQAFDDRRHGAQILIYRTHGASAGPGDG